MGKYRKNMGNIWEKYGKHMGKYGKHMGNIWETYRKYGKIWKTCGTHMGKIWETYGKNIGTIWENIGTYRKIMDFQCIEDSLHGHL